MTRCTARGVTMAIGAPGVRPVGERRVITVVVADDKPLMRSALRMCLCAEPDIEVVGEAADGREAVVAERLRPDVVIMDIRIAQPGRCGRNAMADGRCDQPEQGSDHHDL
jgi:CheY-like chemotaxis protein